MSAWYGSFGLVMALAVMALAVYALPPTLRPMLLATAVIGILVALAAIVRKTR